MSVLRQRHNFATIATLTFLLLLIAALALIDSTPKHKLIEGSVFLNQEKLSGPGSSPPTCRSKCGRCSPCNPVRVSVHPGFTFTLEYYPEAWRCKCRNRLFMP